jgi:hypothetical protein
MARWVVQQMLGKGHGRKFAHPSYTYLQVYVPKRYVNSSREEQNSHINKGCELKVER